MEQAKSKTMNPYFKAVANAGAAVGGNVVTKGGVCAKILYFFIINFVGVAIEMSGIIPNSYADLAGGLSALLMIVFMIICGVKPRSTPLWGTIYSLFQGYFLGWIATAYASLYDGIIPIAILITAVVVFTMLILYSTGMIKVGQRFRSIISSLFFAVLVISLLTFVSSLFTNSIVNLLYGDGTIGLIYAIVCTLIIVMHLAVDFDNISRAIEGRAEKIYEWALAMALVTTIIMLFIRILELLGRANR